MQQNYFPVNIVNNCYILDTYLIASWYNKKLKLQAEPNICEQPVFTPQQNYINYMYIAIYKLQ